MTTLRETAERQITEELEAVRKARSDALKSIRDEIQVCSLRDANFLSSTDTYQTPLSRFSFSSLSPASNTRLTSSQPLCKPRNGSPILLGRTFIVLMPNSRLTGSQNCFYMWSQLWLSLAIAQKELELPVSDEAIEQMKENLVRTPNSTLATRN